LIRGNSVPQIKRIVAEFREGLPMENKFEAG
jgi:hypothetical protein